MTYILESVDLLALLLTLWDEAEDGYVHWPGTALEAPDPDVGGAWIRPRVQSGEAFRVDLGPSNYLTRHTGNFEIQIFTPMDAGPEQALALVDQLRDGLSDQRLSPSNVLTRTASARDAGDDGTWAQMNISVPFQRDRVTP